MDKTVLQRKTVSCFRAEFSNHYAKIVVVLNFEFC